MPKMRAKKSGRTRLAATRILAFLFKNVMLLAVTPLGAI
jgi:hypothetical protein